jgi:O-antigen/teichoic acid export membrane protein
MMRAQATLAALPEAPLRRRVLQAGGWSMAGYAASQALRLGGNLLMTRLLVPEMFGVMAIAMMVPLILGMLSDCGLQHNIVQSRRGDDPAFLDTAWVVQVLRGFLISLGALLVALAVHQAALAGMVPAHSVYAAPELPAVIAVYGLSGAILGFQSTRAASALRNFRQKRLVQIELASQCAGLLAMAALGVATRSIWALVAGGLVAALVSTALSHAWMSGHANRWRWERAALRELVDFGKWIFLSSAVYVLAVSGDRLLLGGFVDPQVLGLYAIAALLVGAVEGALHRLFMAVSLPALSEIARHDPARLREVYYRLRVPCDLLLLFLAGLLLAAGQWVIDLLYDARYAGAGGMLQVLGVSLIAARYVTAMPVYVAAGVPRYQTYANVARLVSLYALVPALYWLGGTQAAIWGIALHALATAPFVYRFNARLGLNDWRREASVLPALPAGFVCGTALNLLRG